jgi:hypothetical protein
VRKVEDRHGFEIRLQEPTPTKSLWAALITSDNPLLAGELDCCVKVCLAFTSEDAMEKAHAFVDDVADRVGMRLRVVEAAADDDGGVSDRATPGLMPS